MKILRDNIAGYVTFLLMSNYDKENLTAIIYGEGDWFTAKLIRTIIAADMSNRRRLFLGFPDEVHAVNAYNFGQDRATEIEVDWVK